MWFDAKEQECRECGLWGEHKYWYDRGDWVDYFCSDYCDRVYEGDIHLTLEQREKMRAEADQKNKSASLKGKEGEKTSEAIQGLSIEAKDRDPVLWNMRECDFDNK